jgi:hypothetical protein
MRARYVFDRDGDLVERKTGEPLNGNMPDRVAAPRLMRDVHYKSPLSLKEITSRSQRREEMKIHGVREVDPSEFKPVYRSRKYAERMKGEHDPNAGRLVIKDEAPFKRLSKDELPEKLRKSVEKH